jgi:hypothetical protein
MGIGKFPNRCPVGLQPGRIPSLPPGLIRGDVIRGESRDPPLGHSHLSNDNLLVPRKHGPRLAVGEASEGVVTG